MSKTLVFSASEVKTSSQTANCINVEVETDYQDEVLRNFTPYEIIQNYEDLDKLYEALKEHFNEEN